VPAEFFVQYRDDLPEDTKMVLMHTRFATQGAAEKNENNHPVIYKDTYVTHNGVVYNDDWLFKTELEEYPRVAEVDSIVFPTMIEEWGWEKIRDSLKLVTGSYAVACIQPRKNPDELIIARGDSSPVHYYETNQALVWASEAWHLQTAWEDSYGTAPRVMHSLDEGEMLVIKADNIVRERYMERPSYTSYGYTSSDRQRRFAWQNDEANVEHRGTPNQDCLECGERLGVKPIWGEYETSTHDCKWRVWVCLECYKDKKTADDLEFQYVVDPIESWLTPKAAKPRNIGSISGGSEHVDEFLALQPGQVIPEYLVTEAFSSADCEICGSWDNIYALDDSGLPICRECYIAATDTSEVTLVKCEQCQAWTANATLTMLGSLCDDCVDKKEFASHAPPSFDVCEGCNRVKKSSEMTYGENDLPRCSSCTPTFDLDVALGRLLERYRAFGEDLFETDEAMKLVAEEYRLPDGLLTFICYRCNVEDDASLKWARHTLNTAVNLAVKARYTREVTESA
jgi:hypothetical protein